ncbi:MAG: DUF952 domain-containing protein [Alphaproteobacteria bacterium]|jgi:uncharacterized protein (DUF952 family)|nr:DUF952 domain-containing protein [Alphaproteobacteria bacterium]
MSTAQHIYHLAAAADWQAAQATGLYRGSPDDLRDGFMHFSTAAQVAESAARHRAGRTDQILLCLSAASLGQDLRWETSRGGQLFPHLYAALDIAKVVSAVALPLGADGRHDFPPLLP